jgi:predicted O-linked N-acetylglucosamine transferase (SPINDLY family)
MSAMDYLLADRFHVPPGEEDYYSESILRMPNGYACYEPPGYAPEVATLPASRVGHVTFGCFNNPAKLTLGTIDRWGEILRRVTSSRLLLKYGGLQSPNIQVRLRTQFAQRGIDPARIILEGYSPHPELLAAYHHIDIALDTQPYSGGLTTCEALWMGVPVVTFPGKTFAGRHAASYMTNAGYPEFVASDAGSYVNLAVKWASRLDELAVIRSQLREQVRRSAVCDAPQFAHDLLGLLRQAYDERWVRQSALQ